MKSSHRLLAFTILAAKAQDDIYNRILAVIEKLFARIQSSQIILEATKRVFQSLGSDYLKRYTSSNSSFEFDTDTDEEKMFFPMFSPGGHSIYTIAIQINPARLKKSWDTFSSTKKMDDYIQRLARNFSTEIYHMQLYIQAQGSRTNTQDYKKLQIDRLAKDLAALPERAIPRRQSMRM